MWGDGSHVAYHSDRPVVVAELLHGDYGRGLEDAVQSLYGDDPGPIIERRRVRYLVLVAQDPSVEQMHRRILGLGPPTKPPLFPHLFDFDGGSVAIQTDEGTGVIPARGDLRLVHEAGFSSRRGTRPFRRASTCSSGSRARRSPASAAGRTSGLASRW